MRRDHGRQSNENDLRLKYIRKIINNFNMHTEHQCPRRGVEAFGQCLRVGRCRKQVIRTYISLVPVARDIEGSKMIILLLKTRWPSLLNNPPGYGSQYGSWTWYSHLVLNFMFLFLIFLLFVCFFLSFFMCLFRSFFYLHQKGNCGYDCFSPISRYFPSLGHLKKKLIKKFACLFAYVCLFV